MLQPIRKNNGKQQTVKWNKGFSKAEEKLQLSYEYLNTLLLNLPVGVAILEGPEFRYFRINKVLADINGLSVKEHLGKTVAEVLPKAAEHIIPNLRKIRESGEAILGREISIRLPKNPQEIRYITDFHFPIKIDGKVKAVGAVVMDITDRKKAEEKLKESEEKYRNLTEGLNELIYSADPKTFQVKHVNKAIESIYGYTVEEWLKDTSLWENTIYPDDKDKVFAEFSRAQKIAKDTIVEYRIIRKDKEMRQVEDHFSWEKNKQGKAVSLNGVMYDVTEQKKAEERIKKLNHQNELILKAAGEGIFGLDIEGKITFVNPAAANMLGWKVQELVNQPQHSLIHHSKYDKSPYPREESPIYAALKDGVVHHVDNEVFWRKDGTSFPVDYVSTPIQENGGLVGAVVAFKDISQKTESEKQLKKAEEKIIKLTKEIPLTYNEKMVLYGIVEYPLYSDIEISKKLKIKRSTINAIKNKLRKEGYYSPYRIPNFSLLGCELISVIHAKLNSMEQYKLKKFDMLKELEKIPEKINLTTTNRDLLCICISRNLTDFRKNIESIFYEYKKFNLIDSINIIYFPYELSKIEKLFDYGQTLKSLFGLYVQDEPKTKYKEVKRELTKKEKSILYALVKFPGLNDSEISEKTKIPRPSISQTRRRLIQEGFLREVNIPHSLQLKCELLVLKHIKFNSKIPLSTIKRGIEYFKNSHSSVLTLATDTEMWNVEVFNNYADYDTKQNNDYQFYNKNQLLDKIPTSNILPLTHIQFEKMDFTLLTEKVLNINVDF